jgi:hypothetical protein
MQLALFDVEAYRPLFYHQFLQSELGQLFTTIPFQELSEVFQVQAKDSKVGAPPTFSIQGGLGLMFLKHYTGLSDAKLIDRVNTDWHYQCFCGLAPRIDHGIKDRDMVGRWRRFFGMRMDINGLQEKLAVSWKEDLEHQQVSMQDATVYESYIKYPTDLKLLWDCLQWLRAQMEKVGKLTHSALPRSKYDSRLKRYISFSKRRKKTYKLERKERKAALYLLDKLQRQFQAMLNRGGKRLKEQLKPIVFEKLKTLRQILLQQQYHYNQPKKSVPHRIVSFYKPYLRPIVRGKENKSAEFGAKVHQVQVGGCNFIEKLDFEAFHEGNRLKKSIRFQQQLFRPVRQVAADGIYANNRNRKWCRAQKIATSFIPKGRQGANKSQADALRQTLSIIRSTRLEGSFGNEKNHYLLRKVKARTKETEIAWIFFGVHCANAVKIAKARQQKQQELKRAA